MKNRKFVLLVVIAMVLMFLSAVISAGNYELLMNTNPTPQVMKLVGDIFFAICISAIILLIVFFASRIKPEKGRKTGRVIATAGVTVTALMALLYTLTFILSKTMYLFDDYMVALKVIITVDGVYIRLSYLLYILMAVYIILFFKKTKVFLPVSIAVCIVTGLYAGIQILRAMRVVDARTVVWSVPVMVLYTVFLVCFTLMYRQMGKQEEPQSIPTQLS